MQDQSVGSLFSSEVSLLSLQTATSCSVLTWSSLCACLCLNFFFLKEQQSHWMRGHLKDLILTYFFKDPHLQTQSH